MMNKRKQNGSNRNPQQIHRSIRAWGVQHLQALIFSLGQLWRNPIGSFLTTAVIGISLTLPAAFYVFLQNAESITKQWDGGIQMTLFLKMEIDETGAKSLANELRQNPVIKSVRLINREQALEEYRQLSGFAKALDLLDHNPLPYLLLIQPRLEELDHGALMTRLQQRPEVDLAIFDRKWLQRLFVIIEVTRRVIYILSCLLALAVLLIIGNTIRLGIFNKRQEIEIIKLFGGTNAFIQRPFLYSGFWLGLAGSFMAWLLITISMQILKDPINELAVLYNSQFKLMGLALGEGIILLTVGSLLGLIGSWVSVQRHLRQIEPT